jgi:DnaJ-class molecular chaperone
MAPTALGRPQKSRRTTKERDRSMNAPWDPYVELAVPRAASTSDITDAYHRLVRRHHPDSRDPAAHAAASDNALIRIMAAYAILKDPDRRLRYDRQHPEPGPRSRHYPFATGAWIRRRPPDSLSVTPVRWH